MFGILVLIFSIKSIEFCPVECDPKEEHMCPGEWDPKTGEQITADFCIANYKDDCWNQCPEKCEDGKEIWCTKEDNNGCVSGWCSTESKFIFL